MGYCAGQPIWPRTSPGGHPGLGWGTVLTTTSGSNAAWAPDSRRLVYSSINTSRFKLVVLDLDTGTARTVLTSESPGVPVVSSDGWFTLQPTWSPDGKRVTALASYYAGGRSGGWIALMDPDGNGVPFAVAPIDLRAFRMPLAFPRTGVTWNWTSRMPGRPAPAFVRRSTAAYCGRCQAIGLRVGRRKATPWR